jgi:capsular polysaccharide biosynthesis protein
MTRHNARALRVRDVLRWWPLVILPAVIAVAGALWSVSHQQPTYTATTRLAIFPLAQWDETFLGTSLVRDGGDPKTTAATTASLLDSWGAATVTADYLGSGWTPEAVDGAIKVSAVPDTNVIEVVAHSSDPGAAQRVSEGFAKATLADRWRTISTELDARIAAVTGTTAADPNAGEASAHLQTLTLIRQAGVDPTLRIDSTSPAVETGHLSAVVVVGVAAVGGSAVGLLTALGVAQLRRRRVTSPAAEENPELIPALSANGSG